MSGKFTGNSNRLGWSGWLALRLLCRAHIGGDFTWESIIYPKLTSPQMTYTSEHARVDLCTEFGCNCGFKRYSTNNDNRKSVGGDMKSAKKA